MVFVRRLVCTVSSVTRKRVSIHLPGVQKSLGLKNGKIIYRPYIALFERNVRKGFLTLKDFLNVVNALPEYLRAPMEFAYFTGWRMRSEVLALRWLNVDFEAGTVRLEPGTTKNNEGRLIYMTGKLRGLREEDRKKTLSLHKKDRPHYQPWFSPSRAPDCQLLQSVA